MRLDKPVGAWGAGISCSGSGIIPISLQSDAPNPTGQVHHGAGCPPCTAPSVQGWFSRWRLKVILRAKVIFWMPDAQNTRACSKTFSGSQQGFGQLTRLLTMKSWRFKMLIETAQITLIVESSFKKGAETLFYSQFYSELHLPNGLCLHQCSVWVLVEVCALRFVGKSKVSIFKKLGISFPTNWTFKGCF